MLKNLKSLFIVTEDAPTAPTAPSATAAAPSGDSGASNRPKIKVVEKNPVDNAILDRLLKAIDDNNQQGFDYLEYRRSLKSLDNIPIDEAIKFQTAYATASTMDVTLEKLLASIDFYKKVLQIEQENFNKATKEQYSINVDGKIKEREKYNAMIKEKGLMIQKLTEEIRTHQDAMDEITKAIGTAETRIEETREHFNQAHSFLLSQMELDAEKLKRYIK